MRNFIMWFYGVDAAQAAAREPAAWFALIVTIAALLTWLVQHQLHHEAGTEGEPAGGTRPAVSLGVRTLRAGKAAEAGACQMMGAAAVAVVVVCAVMYTIFEVIERRKRKKFAEDIRRYIQNHKGEWTSDNQDLR